MFSHGSNDSRGVLIAFREGLHFTVEKEMKDSKGRILMLKSVIQNSKYLLINFYNANTEQQQVDTLKEVSSMLDQIDLDSEYKLIWGGDFNFCFDLSSEADGGKPSIKLMSLAKFESIKQKLDLCDVWRIRNPDSRRFTYRSKSPFLQRRLDYLFISDSIQEDVNQIDILVSLNSDHSPVYLKFSEGNETSRGPSYWKFNNSLLDDQHFVTSLTERINYIIDNELNTIEDVRIRWDILKYRIRQYSMKYSKTAAERRRKRRLELESKVKELEAYVTAESSTQFMQDYEAAESELEGIYNYITEGIILRSRDMWYELGEKSTKYFLTLEKRQESKSSIKKLIVSNREIVGKKDVNKIILGFYSDLFRRKSILSVQQCKYFLDALDIPRLTEEDRNICEGLLTPGEFLNALNSMSKNKSPGNDGLTREFYIQFYDIIKNVFIRSVNHSHKVGELSTSQKQAVVEKKQKQAKTSSYRKKG